MYKIYKLNVIGNEYIDVDMKTGKLLERLTTQKIGLKEILKLLGIKKINAGKLIQK